MKNNPQRQRHPVIPLTIYAVSLFCLLVPISASAQAVTECIVNAAQVARVGAASRGVLARFGVGRADTVRTGDVMAELEASQEDSEVRLARLRLSSDIAVRLARRKAETAEANAARLTTLLQNNLVPKSEQENALLEARTARLEEEEAVLQQKIAAEQLEAALAARERKRIRAPFDGVVTDKLMSVGELYNEQEPVVVVARIDPLHVEAYLPAARRAGISLGDTVDVVLESRERVQAVIDVIDPVLDAATGTFGIRLRLSNPEGRFLAGQSCAIHFE